MSFQPDDDAASTCSTQSRQSTSSRSGKRASSTTASRRSSVEEEPMEVVPVAPEPEEENGHPLGLLIRAAKMMNPVQFDLPKDLTCPINFPGE